MHHTRSVVTSLFSGVSAFVLAKQMTQFLVAQAVTSCIALSTHMLQAALANNNMQVCPAHRPALRGLIGYQRLTYPMAVGGCC